LEKPAHAERHLLELRDGHLLAQLQRRPDADLRVVRDGKVLETRAQELPRVERRYVERALLAVHKLDDAVASFEWRRRRGHARAGHVYAEHRVARRNRGREALVMGQLPGPAGAQRRAVRRGEGNRVRRLLPVDPQQMADAGYGAQRDGVTLIER